MIKRQGEKTLPETSLPFRLFPRSPPPAFIFYSYTYVPGQSLVIMEMEFPVPYDICGQIG